MQQEAIDATVARQSYHMTPDEFRRHGHALVEWIARYYEEVEQRPVLAQVAPGDVRRQLPPSPPANGESFEAMLRRDRPRVAGIAVNMMTKRNILDMARACKESGAIVVLGGPEVSYECGEQEIVQLADYVITGWGDVSFPKLCRELLAKHPQAQKIIAGEQPALSAIKLPYTLYSDEDIAHRLIYVEASRGCPFKCEFCLSSLDKTAWAFDLDLFLAEMAQLYERGARQFKFVDRTFNLNIKASSRILEFFLARLDEKLFVHFEVIPDHLPDALKALISRFPAGSLQFEVGVQTFNPEVQLLISRKQDTEKTETNLPWLRRESHSHVQADLIISLPSERTKL